MVDLSRGTGLLAQPGAGAPASHEQRDRALEVHMSVMKLLMRAAAYLRGVPTGFELPSPGEPPRTFCFKAMLRCGWICQNVGDDTPVQRTICRGAPLLREKNRAGRAMIDLEFQLRAQHFAFNPKGRMVEQKLIDEKIIVE